MSNVIDQKVVEMQFDNRDFEKNAKESISTLSAMKTAISYLTDPVGTVRNAFEKLKDIDLSPLSIQINNAAASFQNFTKTVVDVYAIGTAVRALNTLESQVVSLTKSMSIDQISAGWGKYAEKTISVQTIMAATGKSIEEINESLDRLSWFSDETSYSFNDMTTSLGKFTSAGVELNTGIKAMMGISNLAALAGQGTAEASRAMYNFAQALAVGSVKAIDWKSIENANMATVEFKQAVMDSAVEVGTLVKVNDKYYTKSKRSTVTTENFASTLNEAWFSSEVLIKSLDKYGSYADKLYKYMKDLDDPTMTASDAIEQMGYEVDDLGYKSFKAAQEALTFKHAIDSVKDAVSSGWSETFENIFGNYDEARKLWTDVANELYDIFATGGNERNDLLSEALGLNHHDKLISHIKKVGATEEEFNKAAAVVLKRHGFNLRDLGKEYKSLEEYVANNSNWARPELIAETLDELSKSYTVSGNSAKDAKNSWELLQNRITTAGGSLDKFKQKAVELSGVSQLDIFTTFGDVDSFLMNNLDSTLISETFQALAEDGKRSNDILKKNSVSLSEMNKLIDDILNGKLGVGQERIDAITKKGLVAAEVQELVNKRARGQKITLKDLDKTLAGVEGSSEELIASYEKLSKLYGTTEENLKNLAEESRTTGTEMWRLSKYFTTESGRKFIADSMIEALEQLKSVIDIVKEAWEDIFPPMTALRLTEIIQKIKDFIFSMRLSEQASADLKSTFSGLFSILRLGKQVIETILHLLSPILRNILKIRDGILGITGSFGHGLDNVTKTLGTLLESFRNNTSLQVISDLLGKIGIKIVEVARNFGSLFTYTDLGNIKIFEILDNVLQSIWERLLQIRENFLLIWNGNPIEDAENEFARFGGIIQGVRRVLEQLIGYIRIGVAWIAKQLSSILSFVRMIFSQLNMTVNTFLRTITNGRWIRNFGKLLSKIRSFLNEVNFHGLLQSIKNAMHDFGEFFRDFGYTFSRTIEELGYTIKEKGREFQAKAVTQMAFGIAVIAGACALLATVPAEKLIPAATAIAGMILLLTNAMKSINPGKGGIFDLLKKAGSVNLKPLIQMSIAVVLLAKAAQMVGSLELGAMIKGMTGVWLLVKMLTKTLKSLEREKRTYIKGGTTAILMAVAVRILVSAVKQLGELDFTDMMQGVIGVGLVLTELSLTYDLLSKNKSKFQTGGLVLLAMSGSVRLMLDVINAFADMDWNGVLRAVSGIGLVLAELSGAYVLLSLNKSKFQMGGATLLMMAASVKIMASVVKDLGAMPIEQLGKGVAAVTLLLGELTGAFLLLQLNKSKFQTGGVSILLMASAVKMLGSVIRMLSDLTVGQLVSSIGAITVVILGVLGLFHALAAMKTVVKEALGGIAAIFLVVLAIKPLLSAITDLARMRPERIAMAMVGVIGAIAAVAASLFLLQFLPAIIGPVMLGIAALAAIAVEVAALIAVMGALYQNPWAQWLIGEGKKFLSELGEAIGGFFGGISTGFADSFKMDLGGAADKLADFMTRLKPFLDSVNQIDDKTLSNLKTLNNIMAEVVAIASADWIYSIVNNGKSALLQIGEQMVVFGEAINAFVHGVLGVNSGAKNAVPLDMKKIEIVKGCLETVQEILSWQLEFPRKEFSAFAENLKKFSGGMKALGPAVGAFFAGMLMLNEQGEPTINYNQLELIKQAVPIVTDLANTEFKATAEKFAEFGSQMNAFARELPGLGLSLNAFIVNASGLIKEDPSSIKITQADVNLIKGAIPIVSDLAAVDFSNATEIEWFSSKTNFELFAENLPDFGAALNQFITAVLGIRIENGFTQRMITANDITNTRSAIAIVTELAGIKFEGDPSGLTTLSSQMTDFGKGLDGLGVPLGVFINGLGHSGFTLENGQKVPAVSSYSITMTQKAIEAVKPLAELEINFTLDNFGNLKTNLQAFGESLEGFGPILGGFISGLTAAGFTTDSSDSVKIPPVNAEQIENTKAAIESVKPLCEIELPNTRGVKGLLLGGEGTLETLADGLARLHKPLYDFITQMGKKTDGSNFDINWGMIQNAKNAVQVIDELAKIQVPESAGLLDWLKGGGTLDMFTKNSTLSNLGDQLSSFIRSFQGTEEVPAISNADKTNGPIAVAKAAVSIIEELAKIELPDKSLGQVLLNNDLSAFAGTFGSIGTGLRELIVNLTNLQNDTTTGLPRIDLRNDFITLAVLPALDIIDRLVDVAAKIPPKNVLVESFGSRLQGFVQALSSNFNSIGRNLHTFIYQVLGISEDLPDGDISQQAVERVSQISEVIAVFAEAAKNIKVGKGADFRKFGEQLNNFVPYVGEFIKGINGIFEDEENKINMEQIKSVLAVVPLISSLFSNNIPSVDEVDENAKSYIHTIADDVAYFIQTLNENPLTNTNTIIIQDFLDKIKEADAGPFSTCVSSLVEDIGTIKSSFTGLKAEMISVGQNVIDGMIQGLNDLDRRTTLESTAGGLGTLTKQAIAAALGIASPSKETRKLGQFTDEGFVQGLNDGMSDIKRAADHAAKTAIEGFDLSGVDTDSFKMAADSISQSLEGMVQPMELGGLFELGSLKNVGGEIKHAMTGMPDPETIDKLSAPVDRSAQAMRNLMLAMNDSERSLSENKTGKLLDDLVDSVSDANIYETTYESTKKSNLGKAVESAVSDTNVDDVAGFADQVINTLDSRGETMRETADGLITKILEDYKALSQQFREAGVEFGEKIADGLRNTSGTMTEAATEIKNNIIADFVRSLSGLNLINDDKFNLVSGFLDDLRTLLLDETIDTEKLSTIFGSLTEAINSFEPDEDKLGLLSKTIDEILKVGAADITLSSSAVAECVKALADGISNNQQPIIDAGELLCDMLEEVLKNRYKNFLLIGTEFVAMLALGMLLGIPLATSSVLSVCGTILDTFASHGVEQARKFGTDFMQEFANGISSEDTRAAIGEAFESLLGNGEEGAESLEPTSFGAKFAERFIQDFQQTLTESEGIKTAVEAVTTSFDNLITKISTFGENIDLSSFRGLEDDVEDVCAELEEPIGKLTGMFSGIVPDGANEVYNMMDGMINAFYDEDRIQQVVEAALYFASRVSAALEGAWKIHSPSKLTYQMAAYMMEGVKLGIEETGYRAVNAMTEFAQRVSGAGEKIFGAFEPRDLEETTGLLTSVFEHLDELDTDPVIRPVIDTSAVRAGASRIDSIMSRDRAYEVGMQINRQNQERFRSATENNRDIRGNVTYNFNQVNNSPKPLNRLEIYRQSKNLFSQLQGASG